MMVCLTPGLFSGKGIFSYSRGVSQRIPTTAQKESWKDMVKRALGLMARMMKAARKRVAIAEGKITLQAETLRLIVQKNIPKGDVFGVARIAGMSAAKKTGELIPLCHPLPITHVDINFDVDETNSAIHIRAKASVEAKTGVEMEALTAVSAAALTIYDMCKAVDSTMLISDIHLVEKKGGKSGRA